ncbi:hypothetical protein AC1031_014782 [Aphanomyces cochlioides]|nr:hypothetical protein AC1031_014782 [Aphanomyces cochlioides]
MASFARTLVVAALAIVSTAKYTDIRKVVSFGDSDTDTGNGAFVLTKGLIPQSPYYNGRFSNGPTYIELTAAALNATLDNRAVAGATADNSKIPAVYVLGANETFKPPSVVEQVSSYLKQTKGSSHDRTLFTILIGFNDDRLNTDLRLNRTGEDIAESIYNQWEALAKEGATNIASIVQPLQESQFLVEHSLQMHKLADKFKQRYPSANLGLYELPALVATVLAAPLAFGFEHGFFDPCFNGTHLCADPDKYLVFDSARHATAAFHRVISASFVDFIRKWY